MMIARTCDAVSETRATVRRWVRALVRILPAILAITGLAAAQAAAQDAVWPFDIPSQSLPAALDAFAEQAHVQILYKADSVRDLQSAPVSGQFSPAQALHQLLHGTGLSFQSGGPNTITVVPAPETPNDDIAPPAKDYPRTEKPVKVPEILVKDVREREGEASYVAEATSTATKSDIPLIETPQSISVITRSRMVAQEVNSVAEALRYTSGVQAEPFGFEPRFTFLRFRGFDATQNGLFRDGLQLRNPGFAVSYNLEPYGAEGQPRRIVKLHHQATDPGIVARIAVLGGKLRPARRAVGLRRQAERQRRVVLPVDRPVPRKRDAARSGAERSYLHCARGHLAGGGTDAHHVFGAFSKRSARVFAGLAGRGYAAVQSQRQDSGLPIHRPSGYRKAE